MSMGGITKIEAASRQLNVAIDLFFNQGDPIAIHTLAAAAFRVIKDLCKHKETTQYKNLVSFAKGETENRFWSIILKSSNFFKHAEKDPDEKLMFKETGNEHMIYSSLVLQSDLQDLDEKQKFFWQWMTLSQYGLIGDVLKEGNIEIQGDKNFWKLPRAERIKLGRLGLIEVDLLGSVNVNSKGTVNK